MGEQHRGHRAAESRGELNSERLEAVFQTSLPQASYLFMLPLTLCFVTGLHALEHTLTCCPRTHTRTCTQPRPHTRTRTDTHLGRGGSSPSRCSSCSVPRRSGSPGRAGAWSAQHTGGHCSCGSARWPLCRTPRPDWHRQDQVAHNGHREERERPRALITSAISLQDPHVDIALSTLYSENVKMENLFFQSTVSFFCLSLGLAVGFSEDLGCVVPGHVETHQKVLGWGLPGGAVVKGAVLQRQLCHQSPGFAPRLCRNRP